MGDHSGRRSRPHSWLLEGLDPSLGAPLQSDEKILHRLRSGGYVALSAHMTDPSMMISGTILQTCPQFRRTF